LEGGIFLLQPDNSLVRMDETEYDAEDRLQRFLADHSDLLAGDQIDPEEPRRFLLVYREPGIPDSQDSGDRWSLDHLFLDQFSVPTFVEAKRSSDRRARREVVAQMLDYAANATHYWPASKMRELHAQLCSALGLDPQENLTEVFGPEIDIEGFWQRADENLRNGQVRLLFVADRLPPELRRIIEFLNSQMSLTEVLGVEVRQFSGGSGDQQLTTLVPRVIGQTEAAKEKKVSRRAVSPYLPLVDISDFPDVIRDSSLRKVAIELTMKARDKGWRPESRSDTQHHVLAFRLEGLPEDPFRIRSDGSVWVALGYEGLSESQQATQKALRVLLETVFPKYSKQILNNKLGAWLPLPTLLDPGTAARFEQFQESQNELLSAVRVSRELPSQVPV
jgi:hypothetical protein